MATGRGARPRASRQATRDDIVAQHRRILAKDNLVVSIVGAIDAVDAAAMLDQVFGDMPTTAILTPVAEVMPEEVGRRKVIDLDVPQTVLQLAGPGVKRDDPDFLAAYTVNHVLGGGAFSSWLWRKVREERGLAYSVSTQLATFARSAFIGAGVATRNDRAAESLAIIEAEMERMAREGPDARTSSSAPRSTSSDPTPCASTPRRRSPTSSRRFSSNASGSTISIAATRSSRRWRSTT